MKMILIKGSIIGLFSCVLYIVVTLLVYDLDAQTRPTSSLLYNFHREGSEVGTYGSCDFTVIKLADGTIVGTCFCNRGGNDGSKCGISVSR